MVLLCSGLGKPQLQSWGSFGHLNTRCRTVTEHSKEGHGDGEGSGGEQSHRRSS